ncbi:MAG: DUF2197 domain-containing protein [Syntrophomonadaceae bacterium]|jgi:uncharacterized protein YlaI|nr:DUF2197 domain-containing protein [Syntrophomonadaceae bacterium]
MSKNLVARCLLCGKTYDVKEDHKDFKKMLEQNKELPTFVCDLCNYRVRHESEDKNKPQKPM